MEYNISAKLVLIASSENRKMENWICIVVKPLLTLLIKLEFISYPQLILFASKLTAQTEKGTRITFDKK